MAKSRTLPVSCHGLCRKVRVTELEINNAPQRQYPLSHKLHLLQSVVQHAVQEVCKNEIEFVSYVLFSSSQSWLTDILN